MKDERRHIELLEVFGEVRLGEGLDAVEDRLEAGLHCLEPKPVAQPLGDRGAGRLAPRKGVVRSLMNSERSARTPARIWWKASSGRPPGLAAVFSISGSTAPISTAFATRFVP